MSVNPMLSIPCSLHEGTAGPSCEISYLHLLLRLEDILTLNPAFPSKTFTRNFGTRGLQAVSVFRYHLVYSARLYAHSMQI